MRSRSVVWPPVRVMLGCSMGGVGHLLPIVTVAESFERLGHESVVLIPSSLRSAAERAGVSFEVGE